ncbi:MAG: ricin-type beta-trefoil lectin domain protein [Deltaproteobacteria bacterium]|nr:ricin-type beta-trefoil lectin domain protein [Deltaproteobacteria bacterium]
MLSRIKTASCLILLSFAPAACAVDAGIDPDDESEEAIGETQAALALGYTRFQNGEALFVRRCLTANGAVGVPLVAALCDANAASQGFKLEASSGQIKSQTTGPGKCAAADLATNKVVMRRCDAAAADQKWKTSISFPTGDSNERQLVAANGRCLAIDDQGNTSLSVCGPALAQAWALNLNNRTFLDALRTGEVETAAAKALLPAVMTVTASANTLAESGGRIRTWKVHPIAYKPKDVPTEDIGLVVTARDENDAIRATASFQFIRNLGTPNDFHAAWRTYAGSALDQDVYYRGGVVAVGKLGSVLPQSATDAATLVAILRRDFLGSPVSTSTLLTAAQQRTVLTEGAALFGIGTRGTARMTAAYLATALPPFKRLEPVLLPMNPRNGYLYPTVDPNAGPSGCAARTNRIGVATDCASDPEIVPNQICALQRTVPYSTSLKSCIWECCPKSLL